MGNFFTDVIQKDARVNATGRITDPLLLEPITRAKVQAIVSAAAQGGLEIVIFETYRSQARQQMLFAQGATKLQKVGVHGFGLACDLVRMVGGEPTWKVDYSFLGPLAKANGCIWGGDWGTPGVRHNFVDSDHVQRITVAQQNALFAGTWYPDAAYDPYQVTA